MRRRAGVVIIIIVLFILAAGTGYAMAGDGNGDGSGGGQNNPLYIESSIPSDGATGVENLEFIKLVFSKNVVYMTIRDSNKQCFSLWTGTEQLPAEIILADDQIEREKRNDVVIKPLQPLKAGTTYRVEVSPAMESKSGVTLGSKKTISFTTAGSKAAPTSGSSEQTAASGTGDLKPDKTPEELTAQTAAEEELEKEATGETKTGDVDGPRTVESTEKHPENIKSVSPAEQNQTAGDDPDHTDPLKRTEKAGLWIAVAALAVLAAGWGYRRLHKTEKD